ncbi:hypothetical protein LOD99_4528 [Oopsacas minuta]|uniref:Uncharacterized protein n=1 Tax=Oopsacas minuta TaxID=111878 RepID=A0AAV7JTF4_9METZ|nr:hypothetical protein LOD99_4528 [Oopsacas minuta]
MKKKYRTLILIIIPIILIFLIYTKWPKSQPRDITNIDGEVIHIVSVIAGQVSCRTAMPFLKSLLFHRRSGLHLHIITNSPAYTTLSVLFRSWEIEDVEFSFYHLENFEHLLNYIPNSHHSGIFGLSKLIVEEILPITISKVILLDTDIVVIDSLQGLWDLFELMGRNQFIGLVENLSNYYTEKRMFTSLGRGYNTGVMLMDLEKMRAMKWLELWQKEHTLLQEKIGRVQQADQDIINSFLSHYPDYVYQLPCVWNYQISAKSLAKQICNENSYTIVHWNSPSKHELETEIARSVANLYHVYLKLDGNAVKNRIFLEANKKHTNNDLNIAPCAAIHQAGTRVYRTHPYFIPSSETPASNDITLVAQLSMDRLHMLERIAKEWEGHMSIAIYTMDYELEAILMYISECHYLKSRKNISFHIVFRTGDLYPVNYLRNVAMNFSSTDAVFVSDIDFLPMADLDSKLKNWLANENSHSISDMKAYIVPAFETLRYKFSSPDGKSNLIQMWDDGLIDTFRHFEWSRGHAATNYTLWREAISPYRVDWDMDYEPYILLPKKGPIFDTRFVGFGWNKVSFIIELDALNYEFWVLPDVFMIHMPHSPSLDISQFRDKHDYRLCLQEVKDRFLRDLVVRFGTSALKYAQFEG